ncbi:MAG: amidase [Kofleriaceae bacterium]
MAFTDYDRHDGLGLAELVRTKQVHPRELVDEAIARIERANPRINAVIHRMYDSARATADAVDVGSGAPFVGVPFLAKDLMSTWAGEPQASGSRLTAGWRPDHDSELVTRWRAAGVICVGKTSTPEFGIVPVTEPVAFGPTRNPWDLDRTPGGSSGGSGAAVAAGFVPLASGGDGGGSIRIPSSCCGLFGLKPTRGRTPGGPDRGESWQGCAIEHVLTRTVRDSAAMLDATHGIDPGAPYAAPAPTGRFLDQVGAAPGKLRIAFTRRALLPAEVDPVCAAAAEDAARLLTELGHEVVEDHPSFDAEQLSLDFLTMLVGEVAADVAQWEQTLGRRARVGDLEKETAVLVRMGHAVPAVEFALAARRLRLLARQLAPFFATYDVLLTPTLAQLPLSIGALAPKAGEAALLRVAQRLPIGGVLHKLGALDQMAGRAWAFTPFTAPWNVTGQPACNLPLTWHDRPGLPSLPVGVQLVGRFGDEATLLRLASQCEAARPWRERRPPAR